MKIKSISYKSNLPSLWDKILPLLLSPLIILLGIIVILWLPVFFIYIFIKEKILGIKDKKCDILEIECILIENDTFKIIVESMVLEENEEIDFIYNFFEEYDDLSIYKLVDEKQPSGLGSKYITEFYILSDKKIWFQQICKVDNEIKTFLISFDIITAKVEVIKEIGQYILVHYDEKNKTITGFGKDDNIKIELE